MKTYTQDIELHNITTSSLRPTIRTIPFIKPSDPEIKLAYETLIIPSIVVKPIKNPKPVGPRFSILVGEKYWFLAQACQIDRIICEVLENDISEQNEIKLIKGDIESQDIIIKIDAIDPIEEALKHVNDIQQFKSRYQYCKVKKIDQGTLAHKLNLLKLSEPVKQLIRNGSLLAGHARFLYKFSPTYLKKFSQCELKQFSPAHLKKFTNIYQISLAEYIIKKKLTTSNAWKVCHALINEEALKDDDQLNIHIVLVENELMNKLGTQVKIKSNESGRGSITINFHNTDAAQVIFETLGFKSDDF